MCSTNLQMYNNVLHISATTYFLAFRGKMVKILSQVSLLVPRTAAVEALTVTEQMVQKKLEPGQGEYAFALRNTICPNLVGT